MMLADLDWAKLVEQAVRFAANVDAKTLPLWAVLKSVFGIGSTRAHQLARRFGLDPDRLREGRVVDMGEGCYCNACDSYHCAQCGEVTAHSADCENCLPHQIPASNGVMLAALAALLLIRRQSEIAQRDRPQPPERSDTPDADRLLRHF